MPPPPKNQNKRDFPGRRGLSITFRSLHLVGVVLLGIALLGSGDQKTAGLIVLATGLAIYSMDLWCNPKHFGELAGVFILLKLLLVGFMLVFPTAAIPLFWALVITSSLVSHATGPFRHIRIFN
jgi:hypothetical protein